MLKRTNDKKIFKFILNNLRDEDLRELKDIRGKNWFKSALKNLEGTEVIVMFAPNEQNNMIPIAMGGFEPYFENGNKLAIVWLLSTKFIKYHKFLFWKELKTYFNQEKSKYSILFNFIYKSNFQAKSWLKLLGFSFDNPKPQGIDIPENFEFFYKVIN